MFSASRACAGRSQAGRDLRRTSSEHADPGTRRAGLAYVPADRERVGLSLTSQVWENLTVGHLPEFSRGAVLMANAARRRAERTDPQVRCARRTRDVTPAGSLSGGNQQKVQLARELTRRRGS